MSEIVYELYDALKAANIPEEKARAAAEAMNQAVDSRYAFHSDLLATKSDLADAKVEIIKWSVGSIFVAVGLVATIIKLLG